MYGGGKQYLGDRAAGVTPSGIHAPLPDILDQIQAKVEVLYLVAGIPSAPAGLPSKLHEARYVADIQTNRLLGQLRASIRWRPGCCCDVCAYEAVIDGDASETCSAAGVLHCRGGVTIGGLAAVFYTTQILSSIARARKDHRDVMAAGLATGAAAGLFSEWCPLLLAACNCARRTLPVDKTMCSSILTSPGSASQCC